MSEHTQADYLIVGQGLAGSVLAIQLTQAGKKVLIIGKEENYSSRVAAGLFNPVTGKILSKTWMADDVFSSLHAFYKSTETLIDQHFFHPFPIYRPFLSIEEQNEWMGKSASPEWQIFIQQIFTSPSGWQGVHDPFGGLLLKQTGYVNTGDFLDGVRIFFQKRNQFLSETFEYSLLNVRDEGITYKQLSASRIIFCEGVESLSNPFFNWLPVRPLKGETLTIEASLPENAIINRGVYAVPQGNRIFKVGATYETKDLSPTITEKGAKELSEKFEEIFTIPYTLLGQEWGLRPTTPDRRPIIGEHPLQKNVLVCNGLGTKGVSLAPFAGQLLTDFLLTGTKPPTYAMVDVNRYYSLYWKAVQNT